MKKVVARYVALLIMFSAVLSFAETSSLTYGMTKKEVTNILGPKFTTNQLKTASFGTLDVIAYKNQSVSKYNDAGLNLLFANDSFVAKMYVFDDDKGYQRYNYLNGALQKKYGEKEKNDQFMLAVFELLGMDTSAMTSEMLALIESIGNIKYMTWENESGEVIVLCNANSGKNSMTTISYLQKETIVREKSDYDDSGL